MSGCVRLGEHWDRLGSSGATVYSTARWKGRDFTLGIFVSLGGKGTCENEHGSTLCPQGCPPWRSNCILKAWFCQQLSVTRTAECWYHRPHPTLEGPPQSTHSLSCLTPAVVVLEPPLLRAQICFNHCSGI